MRIPQKGKHGGLDSKALPATKRWLEENKPDKPINLKPGGRHCYAGLLELYEQHVECK